MNEQPSELMVEILKRIQADIAYVKNDMQDLKQAIIGIRQQLYVMEGNDLRQERTVAGLQLDMERIKNRLDLSDA
jgi:hypothetical protein